MYIVERVVYSDFKLMAKAVHIAISLVDKTLWIIRFHE